MATTRLVIGALPLCAGLLFLCNHENERALTAVAIQEVEIASLARSALEGLVPSVVQDTLIRVATAAISGQHDSPTGEDELLRLNVPRPGKSALQLFVAHQTTSSRSNSRWVLLLHDPETNGTTEQPVTFSGRWLGDKGVRPRLADLDRDGSYEVVYRDVQHNGTVTNTEQAVFLLVGEDLSLTETLRLDVSDSDIYSRGEWGAIRSRLMHASEGGDELLVLESWKENPRFGNARQELEPRLLERDPLTGVWSER